MSSIEQTIDALTFAQTHVIDTDFRAHSKSTLDSVLSLQEDQRNRVEHAFRGIRPSPTFLAQTLLSSYRGEAASVTLAKEAAAGGGGGGADPSGTGGSSNVATAIDLMSDNKCRAFKKEMKQRIHEWEGAFREHHGRDAAPQDKATLRPVYELYKHAKARVVQSGDGAATPQPMMLSGTPAAAASHHPSPLASYGTTPMSEDRYSSAAGGSRPSSTPTTTAVAGYRSGGTAMGMDPPTRSAPSPSSSLSAPASSSSQQQQQQYTSTSQGSSLGTPRTTLTPRGSSGPVEPPPSPNRHSAGSSSGGAPPPPQPLPPATAAVVGVNIEELLNEKRRIKRTLHQFESAFESQHGRRPTRDDRKDYNTEYHRYGELKALLNELGRGND